jgi:CxxC motif-containing protein (DUF1111 family)
MSIRLRWHHERRCSFCGAQVSRKVAQAPMSFEQLRSRVSRQRVFFLHDGRTSNLVEAIEAHGSPSSEASKVIERFNRLPARERQDIINFLPSL